MADNKTPSRTMRGDPPAHPNEALRTVSKGCMESIRNRKGVNDNIAFEVPDPDALYPSPGESALEFLPEMLGQAAGIKASTGTSTSLDGPSPTVMAAEPMPGLMDSSIQLQSLTTGKVTHQITGPMLIRKLRRAPVLNILARAGYFAAESVSDVDPVYSPPSPVNRNPKTRPPAERFPAAPSAADILRVFNERLQRFRDHAPSAFLKDMVKRELEQAWFELEEMDVVERS